MTGGVQNTNVNMEINFRKIQMSALESNMQEAYKTNKSIFNNYFGKLDGITEFFCRWLWETAYLKMCKSFHIQQWIAPSGSYPKPFRMHRTLRLYKRLRTCTVIIR
jgi:hypothetical protein